MNLVTAVTILIILLEHGATILGGGGAGRSITTNNISDHGWTPRVLTWEELWRRLPVFYPCVKLKVGL